MKLSLLLIITIFLPIKNLYAKSSQVFNSTQFSNSKSLNSRNVIPATVVYDVWRMTCTDKECENVPDKKSFDNVVEKYINIFGSDKFIIFDFEGIVLDKASSQGKSENSIRLLRLLLSWARQLHPEAQYGLYDYDWNNNNLTNRLSLFDSGGFDFFAPTLYQRWTNHPEWSKNLDAALNNDRLANRPVYFFLSPYYNGKTADGYLGNEEWKHELEEVKGKGAGIILWAQSQKSKKLSNSDGWVKIFLNFSNK